MSGLELPSGIKIDQRLLTALAERKLVVFAGAGVSDVKPDYFRDFGLLANEIAKQFSKPLNPKNADGIYKTPIDRYLGQINDENHRVHQEAKRLLGKYEGESSYHKNLLSIFKAQDSIRIVTTNFDTLFKDADQSLYSDTPTESHYAPALPDGEDFTGIVYLHGSITQEAKRLIITDRDFGNAYITKGWARRFLVDLFRNYNVLFIGYSHNDPIMHYLTISLSNAKDRFAFCTTGREELWESLGIIPISFERQVNGNPYQKLVDAVYELSTIVNQSYLDVERKIVEIIQAGPEKSKPYDVEYLKHLLTEQSDVHQTAIRTFVENARTVEWLEWVEAQGFLENLFNPMFETTEDTVLQNYLCSWLADNYVIQHPYVVLYILQKKKTRLSRSLWYSISRILNYQEGVEPFLVLKWIPIIISNCRNNYNTDMLNYLLEKCQADEYQESAILLLDFLTKPHGELEDTLYSAFEREEPFSHEKNVGISLEFYGSKYWLSSAWRKVFIPKINQYSLLLHPILMMNLQMASNILKAWDKEYDRYNIKRPAIREHEQNKDHGEDVFEFLIDSTRDSLESLSVSYPELGLNLIKSYLQSPLNIVQRIGIHGLTILPTDTLSEEQKVNIILDKDWLYTTALKPEVFYLLQETFNEIPPEFQSKLISAILAGPPEKDEERIDYDIYNLLVWLRRSNRDHSELNAEISRIHEKHPKFGEREHPDLNSYTTGGSVPPAEPLIEPDELSNSDLTEPLIEKILYSVDNSDWRYSGRERIKKSVSIAASRKPEWGIRLAQLLLERGEFKEDMWEALIMGFKSATLSEKEWEFVLSIIQVEEVVALKSAQYPILYLLQDNTSFPRTLAEQALETSLIVWEAFEKHYEYGGKLQDLLQEAINHAGGKITEYWFKLLSYSIEDNDGSYTGGLPPKFIDAFNMLISSTTEMGGMGRVILGWNSCYLNRLDSTWF